MTTLVVVGWIIYMIRAPFDGRDLGILLVTVAYVFS